MKLSRKEMLKTTQPMTKVREPLLNFGKWRVLGFRKNPRYPEFSDFEEEPWEELFSDKEQAFTYYNKMKEAE